MSIFYLHNEKDNKVMGIIEIDTQLSFQLVYSLSTFIFIIALRFPHHFLLYTNKTPDLMLVLVKPNFRSKNIILYLYSDVLLAEINMGETGQI